MKDLAQLQFLCRRGLKELDLLLSEYLRRFYFSASEEEIAAFKQLLQLEDHSLLAVILSPPENMPENQLLLCHKIALTVDPKHR